MVMLLVQSKSSKRIELRLAVKSLPDQWSKQLQGVNYPITKAFADVARIIGALRVPSSKTL